ncbi:hypothetical protein PsorP6_019249 [Peronosclerospora sorghi]|nr:hypothetical protein PsorP6_019249 [Peronosclerospora sorghi]
MYDWNNGTSESDDVKRPTKRSPLDSDTALMEEVTMIACDLPQSYKEAVNGPESRHWSKAIKNEFEV